MQAHNAFGGGVSTTNRVSVAHKCTIVHEAYVYIMSMC